MLQTYKFLPAGILFLFCFSFFIPEVADAALSPNEILVVINTQSEDSVRLGKLYLKLRNIPADHLAEVKVPIRDQISRKNYDELIAAPIREALQRLNSQGGKIRCIVTVYGVPLRVGAVRPPGASRKEVGELKDLVKRKKEALSEKKEQAKERRESEIPSGKSLKELQQEIRSLQAKLRHISGGDTVAAVDSELALLLWPSYEYAGQLPNPEFLYNRGRIKDSKPVFMISRLDAPTPQLVEGLIRTAIKVEKTGLSGKLYLDARGLKSDKNAYGAFDEDIRRAAQVLEKGTIPVILDNRPELFGPGDAPSAALYCGWYSLAEYKDVFDWSKGAVGYHVASAECRSLHDEKKNYWVKRMIEKGVVATLGPVAEPYLNAFPPPSLFFPLLMSGHYTLMEVFAMSNPFLSWQMVLIGDPLYMPYKRNPAYLLINAPSPPNPAEPIGKPSTSR